MNKHFVIEILLLLFEINFKFELLFWFQAQILGVGIWLLVFETNSNLDLGSNLGLNQVQIWELENSVMDWTSWSIADAILYEFFEGIFYKTFPNFFFYLGERFKYVFIISI